MHIAIAGNIGSGKTTLTGLLSKHYGWDTHFEDVEQNPYLNDFYNDMQRWSFNLQIYYMTSRISKIQELRDYSEQQLGNKFDIKAFHTQILIDGALPMPILESKIKKWVESQR